MPRDLSHIPNLIYPPDSWRSLYICDPLLPNKHLSVDTVEEGSGDAGVGELPTQEPSTIISDRDIMRNIGDEARLQNVEDVSVPPVDKTNPEEAHNIASSGETNPNLLPDHVDEEDALRGEQELRSGLLETVDICSRLSGSASFVIQFIHTFKRFPTVSEVVGVGCFAAHTLSNKHPNITDPSPLPLQDMLSKMSRAWERSEKERIETHGQQRQRSDAERKGTNESKSKKRKR